MCDPLIGAPTLAFMAANAAPIAAGSAVLAAGTSVASGIGQRRLASAQARADDEQGRSELMAASERAARIRMQGQKFLAEQRVQIAANGIEAGSGSALEVGAADAGEIELDALTELYGGKTRKAALNQQASFSRSAGVAAQARGIFGGINDILGASKTWEALGGGTKPATP